MTPTSEFALQNAGRVAVLMGGNSAEREISLQSGRAVAGALRRCGVAVEEIDWRDDLVGPLQQAAPDRVFIALHGRGGEDGQVQGFLESIGLPYTGSNVLGCALSMDKIRSKRIWQSLNIPTPPFQTCLRGVDASGFVDDLTLPVSVKPAREGSSFGVSRVDFVAQLPEAMESAFSFDDEILVERWIIGGEYTVSILCGETLPIIKLETPHAFYDYEAKYVADTTRYLCPCGLDEETAAHCAEIAMDAFIAVGASGWGRVDFMIDNDHQPWVIELNTVPGMTDHSLVPMAANAAGIEFDELVGKILATSFSGAQS